MGGGDEHDYEKETGFCHHQGEPAGAEEAAVTGLVEFGDVDGHAYEVFTHKFLVRGFGAWLGKMTYNDRRDVEEMA